MVAQLVEAPVEEVNLATLLLDEAVAAGYDQAEWAKAELPITGVVVLAGDTYVQEFAVKDVNKAVAKAVDVWTTINGALAVAVVGIPEEAKGKGSLGAAKMSRYALPTVTTLDPMPDFSQTVVCRNRYAW